MKPYNNIIVYYNLYCRGYTLSDVRGLSLKELKDLFNSGVQK